MKEVLFALLLAGFAANQAQAMSDKEMKNLLDQYPNIAVGEVYFENNESYFVAVSGEIKGKLSGHAFEVAKGRCVECELHSGDRVLVFADPKNPAAANIRFSRYEGFKGECSFKVIRSLNDNEFLSNLASTANQKAIEEAFIF